MRPLSHPEADHLFVFVIFFMFHYSHTSLWTSSPPFCNLPPSCSKSDQVLCHFTVFTGYLSMLSSPGPPMSKGNRTHPCLVASITLGCYCVRA